MRARLRRGIEPIVAAVILIAVALVIAIAVVGWVMGLWGGITGTESLRILPDTYISGNTLYLSLRNDGTANAVVYKVEIEELGWSTATDITVTRGSQASAPLTITGVQVTPGAWYRVKVYTRAGNLYQTIVQARAQ